MFSCQYTTIFEISNTGKCNGTESNQPFFYCDDVSVNVIMYGIRTDVQIILLSLIYVYIWMSLWQICF